MLSGQTWGKQCVCGFGIYRFGFRVRCAWNFLREKGPNPQFSKDSRLGCRNRFPSEGGGFPLLELHQDSRHALTNLPNKYFALDSHRSFIQSDCRLLPCREASGSHRFGELCFAAFDDLVVLRRSLQGAASIIAVRKREQGRARCPQNRLWPIYEL
jgi:hypothetical protein